MNPQEIEEEPQEIEEEPQMEETLAPKKRGRPNGSKNKTPDMYTALMDRMTQMEETFKNRESTCASPETPIRMKRPRQPKVPKVEIEEPLAAVKSPAEILMQSLYQAKEARHRKQLDFYATFLPS
jgi:hypothetical protein